MKHCHGNGRRATDCHARSIELSFEARGMQPRTLRHGALHALERQDRNGVRGGDRAMMAWKHRARGHACRDTQHVQREEQECMHERDNEERKRWMDGWMERGREKKKLDAHITCVLSKVVRVCHKYLSIRYISISLPLSYITYPFCTFSMTSGQPNVTCVLCGPFRFTKRHRRRPAFRHVGPKQY